MKRTLSFFAVLAVMLLGMAGGAGAQSYYNAAWQYRRPVTLDSTASVITVPSATNLITLTAANWNFAHAKTDGSDIRVCDTDGATPLPFYLAAYNSGAQTGTLYVKKSLVARQSQTLYIYSGNAAATSTSSFDAAMSKPQLLPDTLCLLHLDDGSGTAAADATGTYPATLVGGATWGSDVAFATGKSVTLDGTSGYVTVPNVLTAWPLQGSISFWFTPSVAWPSGSSDARLISKNLTMYVSSPLSGEAFDCYLSQSTGKLTLRIQSAGTQNTITSTASSFAAGVPHHVAFTWGDHRGYILYLDGVAQGSPLIVNNLLPGNYEPLFIGAYQGGTGGAIANFFRGSIDEVQITGGSDNKGIYRLPRVAADIAHTTYDPNWEGNKWTKQGPVLSASAPMEATALQEPSVLYDGNQFVMWYTGSFNNEAVFRATSPDGIHWKKYSDTPVLGEGQGGESGQASCNNVYLEGGTYYLYYANGNPFTSPQRLATSPDGITWTKRADAESIPSWTDGLTNSYLVKTAASAYTLLIEGASSSSNYFMGRATGTSPLGPFTDAIGGPLTQLGRGAAAGGSYGGPWIQTVNSQYQMWHQSGLLSNNPTDIYRDSSSDLVSWAHYSANDPVLARGGTDTGDQVADPCVLSVNGKSYLWYSSVNNAAASSFLGLATYNGTLAQLTQDGSAVTVGVEGILPLSSVSLLVSQSAGGIQFAATPIGGVSPFTYTLTRPSMTTVTNTTGTLLDASPLAGSLNTYTVSVTDSSATPVTKTIVQPVVPIGTAIVNAIKRKVQ